LAGWLVDSPFGKSISGIRQNERRMRAIGTPVWWRKLALYAVGAAMAGTAGALSAQVTRSVGLNSLSLLLSGTVLMVLILGGIRHRYGAFLGAMLYVVVQDAVAQADPFRWMLVIGALLMAAVLFFDNGLMSFFGWLDRKLRRTGGSGSG
jgi:branched-chain amino acid transport system permease protein